MLKKKLQSFITIVVAIGLVPCLSMAQDATDYMPQFGGTNWIYTTEFTDVMEEFEEDFPESLAQKDSVVSINDEDTLRVYRMKSIPLFDFDEFDDFEEEIDTTEYGWLAYEDMISPLIEFPDEFDEDLPLRTASNTTMANMEATAMLAQEFDPEELEFLPLVRFNTQPGDEWELINVDEYTEIPDEVREEEDFPDFVEAIEIQFQLMGSRHDQEDVELDGQTHTSEVFGTSMSLGIIVHTEDGSDFPDIEADILDDYTFFHRWVESHGAVNTSAESYAIDLEEIAELLALFGEFDDTSAKTVATAFSIQEDEEEEIIIPGFNAQMSDYEQGDRDVSSEIVEADELPDTPGLSQNYPNPFNPATTIEYELPENGQVRLSVYDMNGRHITTLVDENQQAGTHQVTWDASNMASGAYIYKLQYGDVVISNQMMLIK